MTREPWLVFVRSGNRTGFTTQEVSTVARLHRGTTHIYRVSPFGTCKFGTHSFAFDLTFQRRHRNSKAPKTIADLWFRVPKSHRPLVQV